MFFDLDLRGDGLPPKTLCLTFDDGPGPQTADLGDFLADQKIAATFFLIGAHARQHPETVQRLRARGHLIGNHTDSHPTLVSFVRDGGDVVAELARTDEAVGAPLASGEPTYFRAPYGNWRDEPIPVESGLAPIHSTVAQVLNDSGRFPHLIGPVGWDIDATDWKFWQEGRSAEACGQAYLEAIEQAERGVVLLHDSSEQELIRQHNQTEAMVRWLIPILQSRGYHFVRLDRVPAIAAARLVSRQVFFGGGLGQWMTCPTDSTRLRLTTSHSLPGGFERFGVVPVGPAKRGELVGLLAPNGRFLTRTKGRQLVAEALTIEDSARWQLVPHDPDRFEICSSQRESIVYGDHPLELRLRAKPAHPLKFWIACQRRHDSRPLASLQFQK